MPQCAGHCTIVEEGAHPVELGLGAGEEGGARHRGPAVGKLQGEGAAAAQHAHVKVLSACRHRERHM